MNKVNQVGFPKRFYWLMKMGPYLENYSKRYSQSMKPQDMAKVAEAQAEFDHYDKVGENDFYKYRGSNITSVIHASFL